MVEEIEFETAELAKKLGFDRATLGVYNLNKDKTSSLKASNWNEKEEFISAPTQEELHKWIRDIYNVYICILFADDPPDFDKGGWVYVVDASRNPVLMETMDTVDKFEVLEALLEDGTFAPMEPKESYESAMEEGLHKFLTYLINKIG